MKVIPDENPRYSKTRKILPILKTLIARNPMNPSHARRFDPSQRGFALIVTLSLMILLTVIAVGLLTLSSISLRSTTQGEAGAIARANARLALMLGKMGSGCKT